MDMKEIKQCLRNIQNLFANFPFELTRIMVDKQVSKCGIAT